MVSTRTGELAATAARANPIADFMLMISISQTPRAMSEICGIDEAEQIQELNR